MKTPRTSVSALLLALACAALPAQKMPLADGSDRVLQLIDLAPLTPTREGADVAAVLARLAEFLRTFATPPLTAADDAQVLAGRWLAVLGRPEQVASIERIVTAAQQRREDLIEVTVRIAEMPATTFATVVAPRLPKPAADAAQQQQQQAVLDRAATAALHAALQAADATIVSGPRLVTMPLQQGDLLVGRQVSYVKDFTASVAGGQFIADPVIDTVFDGLQVKVLAAYAGKDRICLSCSVLKQDVAQPLPTFQTTLAGSTLPVTIQLPRSTGVRLQQTAELASGSAAVIAAPKTDGGWLVAIVEASTSR